MSLKQKIYLLYANEEFRDVIKNKAGCVHEMTLIGYCEDHARELAQKHAGLEVKFAKKFFSTKVPWQIKSLVECHQLTYSEDELGMVVNQETF